MSTAVSTEVLRGSVWPPSLGPLPEGLSWDPVHCALILCTNGAALSPTERAGLSGPLDLAVLGSENLVGLAVHIDGWGWQDCLTALPGSGIPSELNDPLPPQARLSLTFVVVVNGVVEHLRFFTLSTHSTRILQREVRDRWTTLSNADFAAQAERFYGAHPTTRDALKRAVARCKAGD